MKQIILDYFNKYETFTKNEIDTIFGSLSTNHIIKKTICLGKVKSVDINILY